MVVISGGARDEIALTILLCRSDFFVPQHGRMNHSLYTAMDQSVHGNKKHRARNR